MGIDMVLQRIKSNLVATQRKAFKLLYALLTRWSSKEFDLTIATYLLAIVTETYCIHLQSFISKAIKVLHGI